MPGTSISVSQRQERVPSIKSTHKLHTSSRGSRVRTNVSWYPNALQDLLVGGAVVGAVGAALAAGLRKDPVICDLCQGTGGVKCFGCSGDGKMSSLASRDELIKLEMKRDILGRNGNPRECRVCKGTGMCLCSKCRGSGYTTPL